jgi:hypothetical protein
MAELAGDIPIRYRVRPSTRCCSSLINGTYSTMRIASHRRIPAGCIAGSGAILARNQNYTRFRVVGRPPSHGSPVSSLAAPGGSPEARLSLATIRDRSKPVLASFMGQPAACRPRWWSGLGSGSRGQGRCSPGSHRPRRDSLPSGLEVVPRFVGFEVGPPRSA